MGGTFQVIKPIFDQFAWTSKKMKRAERIKLFELVFFTCLPAIFWLLRPFSVWVVSKGQKVKVNGEKKVVCGFFRKRGQPFSYAWKKRRKSVYRNLVKQSSNFCNSSEIGGKIETFFSAISRHSRTKLLISFCALFWLPPGKNLHKHHFQFWILLILSGSTLKTFLLFKVMFDLQRSF